MTQKALMKRLTSPTRKRGADMTQALLYAAFAIIVLIAVLGMYQVVMMSNNKTTATRTMTMLSNEGRVLYPVYDATVGPSAQRLIDAGAVPTDAIQGETPNQTIKLPYQGTVRIESTSFVNRGGIFQAVIEFTGNSRNSRALCTYLASGDPEGSGSTIDNGPLGSNYVVSNFCGSGNGGEGEGGSNSRLIVNYLR